MPGDDLELLSEAALAAGRIALKYHGNDPKVWEKPDGQGPVSEADIAVDDMLRAELLAARPDYGWMSEESETGPDRTGCERVFIIDPIDGTRAFLSGQRHFAHALAVAEKGKIIAAAVFLPAAEKMYTATLGGGAKLNGSSIRHSGRATVAGASVLSNAANMKPEHWPHGIPDLQRNFRPSLAYRLCLIAEGRFDVMLTFRDAWEWDIAAGDLICREAGAVVTTAAGDIAVYNSPEAKQPGLISAAPDLHAALLKLRRGN